jgi:hypothetical protein
MAGRLVGARNGYSNTNDVNGDAYTYIHCANHHSPNWDTNDNQHNALGHTIRYANSFAHADANVYFYPNLHGNADHYRDAHTHADTHSDLHTYFDAYSRANKAAKGAATH